MGTTVRRGTALLALVAVLAGVGGADGVAAQEAVDAESKISGSLLDDAGIESAKHSGRGVARGPAPDWRGAHLGPAPDSSGRIKVQIDSTDIEAVRAAVSDGGGRVHLVLGDSLSASVHADQLVKLAALEAVEHISEPMAVEPAVESQGVVETGANLWHNPGGHTGAGVKVAIVDIGFSGYVSKLGTELPASVTTANFCPNIGFQASNHGTAVAEIVHDMAPMAQLYLICTEDSFAFEAAADYLVTNGITIANASIGNPINGRGDGSGGFGTFSNAVRRSRLQGVLWTVSSGNLGNSHFNFNGLGVNQFESVLFAPNDPLFEVVVSNTDTNGDGISGRAFIRAKWDAWPVSAEDFDLFIYNNVSDYINFGPPASVAGSTFIQDGSQPPIEIVNDGFQAGFQNFFGMPHTYYLEVFRFASFAQPGRRFDLYLEGDITAVQGLTPGSVVEPATSPYAMAVGAYKYDTGVTEFFSGVGPTIDERVKPDIAGPDGVLNSTLNPFFGTSAAAPHVAGAAALFKGANPLIGVAELQRLLEDKALDVSPPGRDNATGSGKLRMGAVSIPQPATGNAFQPLPSPVRLMDTRFSSCVGPKCTPFNPGQIFNLAIAGLNGVPANATAVVLNVAVAGSTNNGFITLWPAGGIRPNVSNVNFDFLEIISNNVTATLGGGSVSIFNSFGTTPLVIDLAGYYAPAATAGLVALNPPRRALDTRPSSCVGPHCSPLGSGEDFSFQMRNVSFGGTPIPPTATALVLSVAVTQPTTAGHITVYPDGVTRPNTANLNFYPELTIPNLVIVGIGGNDRVRFFNSFGSTHLVVDVLGYFQDGGGARYVPLNPPRRDLDTRFGNGRDIFASSFPGGRPLGSGEVFQHQVTELYGVPSGAVGAVFNVAAVTPVQSAFLSVYPTGAAFPGTSNLNFRAADIISNAVITSIGNGGRVNIFNSFGQTHVVVDIAGYFI